MSEPSHGPPWDLPVDEAPLAFVDLEMTGLDVTQDRVIEVCIERVVGEKTVASIATLVRPENRADGAAHVHGIDADALAAAPPFSAIASRVLEITDGAIFVAHAAAWDARFLEAEMTRAGVAFVVPFFLDTLTLSRRAFALPSHSMDALCKHFSITRERAHRAADDVLALRAVFEKCVAELAPQSARDLWDVRIAERKARAAILEACAAALAKGEPVRVTYRPSRRGAERLEMVFTAIAADLDPPRAIGYQLPGRGRRELRSDRILKIEPLGADETKRP